MKIEELIPGRHYKYKGIWAVVGLWNNEFILYCNADSDKIRTAWGDGLINPRITPEIAAELEEWPNSNKETANEYKAREKALDAALKLYAPSTQTAEFLLKDAAEIFNWLIK